MRSCLTETKFEYGILNYFEHGPWELTRTASFWPCESEVKSKDYLPGLPRWSIFISLFSLFLHTALRKEYLHLIRTKTKHTGSETVIQKFPHIFPDSTGFLLSLYLSIMSAQAGPQIRTCAPLVYQKWVF